MNEKIPFCILFSLVVCSQHANNNHDHKLNSKYIWTRTARAKSQSTERTYMCVCLCVSRCLCDVVVSLYTKWICKESAIKLIFYHNHHSFVRISIIIIISHLHTVYDSWCVRDTANDGNRGQFLFLFLFFSVFHRYIFVGRCRPSPENRRISSTNEKTRRKFEIYSIDRSKHKIFAHVVVVVVVVANMI